ncbi:Sapep family Mn(2+)-dependent dipeptidase [Lapidilactobacillus bayanensis]|uniref:Sapep family Mn(2+)-dependent dipeptidase n=1 Tax=Lapidilactobacillus bayanensis TaxID=2485998 RepID=UPI000F7B4263|nr:Sapep family Mn(2+)-dependent dipeptidase [Lapidilactobacillus bayanensis]
MKETRTDFASLFSQYEESFLSDLRQILRVPSVNGPKTFGAPFGIGPKRILEKVLDIARQMDFRTGQIDNCVGWAEYGPTEAECPEYFAILGHLDVVDVEDDWQYDPFDLTRVDNFMYGRGVLDNKGPIMANLFALYLIKQQDIKLRQRVRIIFGTDEESGSRDIPHYLKKERAPYAGYTPDCKFPVVYGERGLLDVRVSMPITDDSATQVKSLSGHFDRSYLPDNAQLIFADGTVKHYHGKKAPSNAPEMAESVLPLIVTDLKQLSGQIGEFGQWLAINLGSETTGQSLGIDFKDEASGALQLAFYDLTISKQEVACQLTCRYPITVTEEQLLQRLQQKLLSTMTLTVNRSYPSQVTDKDTPLIKRLSAIYQADTGLDGTPVTTTGVTYARAMPNIFAFGPSFPGQKGIAHKGDEWLQFSDWRMMMQIYYDTLLSLND